jgi:predicted DNA-binding transcriptional regulator AlpA
MSRKIDEAEPTEPPLESIVKSARESNCRSSRKTGTGFEQLLTPKEATQFLRVSSSWLAKARMRGDGPPYVKLGRSIRYTETGILQWMRSRQRLSTSER